MLELDVDAFERAARSQQQATLQEARRLYRGEFLEGIKVSEPGFEEWMLSERYRLSVLAADARARLLDLQVTTGDVDAAIDTARGLVALAPLDEPAHARLIQLYGAQGRRGLAEAHYARCTELLRRELDQAPGGELKLRSPRLGVDRQVSRPASRLAQPAPIQTEHMDTRRT